MAGQLPRHLANMARAVRETLASGTADRPTERIFAVWIDLDGDERTTAQVAAHIWRVLDRAGEVVAYVEDLPADVVIHVQGECPGARR